jgi:hypothetical protein
MPTIMPQSELTRKAVTWISEQRQETGKSVVRLIDEASMRFNLGPMDAEFLKKFFAQEEAGKTAQGREE